MCNLNKINIGHCRKERELIKKENRHLSRVVSTCALNSHITWDKSRSIEKGEYCQGMIRRFKKIGGLGNKSILNGCENYVGCCAEQHAANALVKKNYSYLRLLKKIQFSDARRARTLEIIKPCKNCKSLFNI